LCSAQYLIDIDAALHHISIKTANATAPERATPMFTIDTTPFDLSKMTEMFGASDFTKMFDMPEMGAMSGNAMIDGPRKNVEAMMKAQEIATAGYQTIVEKQIAMMQNAFTGMQGQIADLSKTPYVADAGTQQVELAKKAYEGAMADLNELAEIAQKANVEAFAVIKDRVEASMNELKAA